MLLHINFNQRSFVLNSPIHVCFPLFPNTSFHPFSFEYLFHKKKHVVEDQIVVKTSTLKNVVWRKPPFEVSLLVIKMIQNKKKIWCWKRCLHLKTLIKLFKLCIFLFFIHGLKKSPHKKLIHSHDNKYEIIILFKKMGDVVFSNTTYKSFHIFFKDVL
jgi:hypothetical protein